MSGVLAVPNWKNNWADDPDCPGGGNSGLMAQNCSEGEAVELMTQTAPWGNKRADDPVVPRTGSKKG